MAAFPRTRTAPDSATSAVGGQRSPVTRHQSAVARQRSPDDRQQSTRHLSRHCRPSPDQPTPVSCHPSPVSRPIEYRSVTNPATDSYVCAYGDTAACWEQVAQHWTGAAHRAAATPPNPAAPHSAPGTSPPIPMPGYVRSLPTPPSHSRAVRTDCGSTVSAPTARSPLIYRQVRHLRAPTYSHGGS